MESVSPNLMHSLKQPFSWTKVALVLSVTFFILFLPEPSTPGPLVLGNSDLDASDNSISFAWTGSIGEVSGYTVAILDGSTEMINRTLTGTVSSAVIGFGNMKNGYKYTVRIVAYSKTFEGGKTVESDPYTGEIKTDVKREYNNI